MPIADHAGGFLAGTRVHSRDGLVPIESIRVGDWVLSPSADRGRPGHRRVVNTVAFDAMEIFLVRFHKDGPDNDSVVIGQLAVTARRPFWLEERGWTDAESLETGDRIALHDGSHASVICARPVLVTAEAGVGWVAGAWGVEMNDWSGNRVDFRGGDISVDVDECSNEVAFDNPEGAAYKAQVFNLEVEKSHGFFTGALGVWAHDMEHTPPGSASR